jgi:hypothetical protein
MPAAGMSPIPGWRIVPGLRLQPQPFNTQHRHLASSRRASSAPAIHRPSRVLFLRPASRLPLCSAVARCLGGRSFFWRLTGAANSTSSLRPPAHSPALKSNLGPVLERFWVVAWSACFTLIVQKGCCTTSVSGSPIVRLRVYGRILILIFFPLACWQCDGAEVLSWFLDTTCKDRLGLAYLFLLLLFCSGDRRASVFLIWSQCDRRVGLVETRLVTAR